MKNKGERVKIEVKNRHPSILEIDGKKYVLERETTKKIDNIEHRDKLIFKRLNEKEYKKNTQIIVDAISKKTSAEEIIKEILKGFDYKTLRKLARRIEAKKPIKKHNGCLGFKIGDTFIQLID